MSQKNTIEMIRQCKVFISSTFEDLKEERKKAVEVIVAEEQIPIDLGMFAASTKTDLEVILQAISRCHIYIIILGHRYGAIIKKGKRQELFKMLEDPNIDPSQEMSYTEFEYRLAKKKGLEVLSFILKDDEIKEKRKNLNPKNIEDAEELRNYNLLVNFHNLVKEDRFYKPFGKGDEFKFLVLQSLHKAIGIPGWIREPEDPKQQELIESASNNPFILDIVKELSGFKTLDSRFRRSKEKKKSAAQFFSQTYHKALFEHKLNLFLESGSCVTYVVDALAPSFSIDNEGNPNVSISTNNVIAYQLLWLCHKIPITLFPWGGPEVFYGATYGRMARRPNQADRDPYYDQAPLDKDEVDEINKLKDMPFSIAEWEGEIPGLILGATSGLQISENHDIVKAIKDLETGEIQILKEPVEKKVIDLINECYGPHVGSYKNKMFKRFLYDAGQPLMIFLESDKIDCQIRAGVCHFMLDKGYSLEKFYTELSLAFCVGCLQMERDGLTQMFEKLGFEVISGNNWADYTAIIARNNQFIEEFEKKVQFTPPNR
ncbi:MAG: DUF4062 domain-containing protein [Desulfobacteraceae bacterium]|nr:DUF4062 domain-containing protein [Desulfobacteraceae bacterium]